VLIPRVEIGGIVARDNPLRVQPQADAGLFANSDFDGLIGADLLSHFIVTLDLAHDRIGLKRDLKCHTDLDRFSTIGIQFMKDPGGSFTIMSVWSPSPAGDAGLKIGDRVLSVNRMETDPMSLDDLSSQIHGTPGTKVQLLIDSGGQHRDVSMAITCLLCPTESTSER
jgi:C-terminal processing protease CtpA/Prc